MKKILVLGAGFVAGPLVRSLTEEPRFEVIVADLDPARAAALAERHPRASWLALNLEDESALAREISKADLTVSLVPYTYHPVVARICLALNRNMVTTSYVGEAMRDLDGEARQKGLVLLNEVGLDPGIDHMEAMRIIDKIHGRGARVLGFRSYCGGLPAPESRDNPFGYKFSWSPRGVLLAGRNEARYLQEGREIVVPAADLFARPEKIEIRGIGVFEGYPNRNSLPYLDLYGIPEAETMFRGTLRWPGWCETLKAIGDLGLLDTRERDLSGLSARALLTALTGSSDGPGWRDGLEAGLSLPPGSPVLERLAWLGLLDDEPLGLVRGAPIDVLEKMMTARLGYRAGERDMIVLRHEFEALGPDGSKERIRSTLVDYGLPGGDSSMARTVGLPAAAAVRLILDERLNRNGVLIPVHPEIYGPILAELESRGLIFREERLDAFPESGGSPALP